MSKRVLIVLNCFVQLVICNHLHGQRNIEDSDSLEMSEYYSIIQNDSIKKGTYRDLEQAFYNKDSVYYLDLSGYGLNEFPEVILDFENLVVLDLSGILLSFDTVSNYQNYYKKFLDRLLENNTHVYYRRRNFLKDIPCEIANLKQLRIIFLDYHLNNKKLIRRLKKCCPNVKVYY